VRKGIHAYDKGNQDCLRHRRRPFLEIIREEEKVTIFEPEDMDRQIQFPAGMLPAILNHLGNLMYAVLGRVCNPARCSTSR